MDDGNIETPDLRPRLWNPSVAANWSLLLTPAFGAVIHAANWRALGKPERAAANMIWVWLTALLLVADVGTRYLQMIVGIDLQPFSPLVLLALLISWYLRQCRWQMQYVYETFGNDYIKRSWAPPLLVGATWLVVAILVVGSFAPI